MQIRPAAQEVILIRYALRGVFISSRRSRSLVFLSPLVSDRAILGAGREAAVIAPPSPPLLLQPLALPLLARLSRLLATTVDSQRFGLAE